MKKENLGLAAAAFLNGAALEAHNAFATLIGDFRRDCPLYHRRVAMAAAHRLSRAFVKIVTMQVRLIRAGIATETVTPTPLSHSLKQRPSLILENGAAARRRETVTPSKAGAIRARRWRCAAASGRSNSMCGFGWMWRKPNS